MTELANSGLMTDMNAAREQLRRNRDALKSALKDRTTILTVLRDLFLAVTPEPAPKDAPEWVNARDILRQEKLIP